MRDPVAQPARSTTLAVRSQGHRNQRGPADLESGRDRRGQGFFFFSSRRRHTRLQGDWSSDVCSSDLKTLEIDPQHAGAHNNLGYLLERQGKSAEAAAEYRQAIQNKPADRQAHFNLGRVLVNQRDYEEGIRELTKTIEPEDENTPRYVYALGAALARSGDRPSALRYLHRARDSAAALGQSALVASIDRDLRTLEVPATPR